jgi:hypothetical protein
VLKNRETNKELFVVVISLIPSEDGVEDPEEKIKKTHGKEGGAKEKEEANDDLD